MKEVTVFTVSSGTKIHARSLYQDEAERFGTAVYQDTGVVPDIFSHVQTPKDHTKKNA
jgi:hypothetical protein